MQWDTQVRQIIGPRFAKATAVQAVASNFKAGLFSQFGSTADAGFRTTVVGLLDPAIINASLITASSVTQLKDSTTDARQQLLLNALELTLTY